jgi:two-component system sensor histidine kinase BaeS
MARGGLPAHVAVSGRDEIAQLARAFNAMGDALAAQEQVRRRMVTDVAHELRTPLTNLRCELEAIQDGLAAPDGARLGSLHEEVLHLGRLVDDLQELALADAGALTLQRERVDLGATVRRLAELRRADGVHLEIEADDPVAVHADPLRIRQILGNLLANAVRHTPADGRIRVAVRREGGDAVVAVTDSGAGIPASELERIFEPFYRLDAARTRARGDAGDAGGAGLGLAIVRRLVELHGGRVWATSAPDGGATFVVALPLAVPA